MFRVFKCDNCETQILTSEDGKLECCGESMLELVPNSVDASFEKHVPTYEIVDGKVKAKVNHVMEEEHYIIIFFQELQQLHQALLQNNLLYDIPLQMGDLLNIRVQHFLIYHRVFRGLF